MAMKEPWQLTRGEFVDFYRRTRVAPTQEIAPPADWSEAGLFEYSIRARRAETAPPTYERFPVGTWAMDDFDDLWQLREYSFGDPKLFFPEGMPYNETVVKYMDWIRQGHEPPPLKGVETESGRISISEGHHRTSALKKTGAQTVKVWVSLKYDKPLDRGGTFPITLTHKQAILNALAEGKLVPPEVLREYPELAAKTGREKARRIMGLST